MTRPTILDRLQVGGLRPELVREFRDIRRRRRPCFCSMCTKEPEPEELPLVFPEGWPPPTQTGRGG
jgi:hypothetical protein